MISDTLTPIELISVIMPVYRESAHIGEVLEQVREEIEKLRIPFEFILIDDGSPDDTWKVLNELSKRFEMLRAVRLSRNFGKEAALCAGLELAGGDVVISMDADGQHPPALLGKMIEAWQLGGVDIVEVVKSSRGNETAFSKLSAGMFYLLWDKLSGFELRNASDYKLLNRAAVNAYLQMRERNLFFRGMTAWIGFTRAKIPFAVAERAGGRSGWSVFQLLRLALTGITAFSALPLQIVMFAGVFFLLFAFVFGLQTLYVYLSGHAVTGFATVIFLLLIIGSLLMISLGIIGEYLARIYDEVKARPRFLISQTLGFPNRPNAIDSDRGNG